MRNKQAVGSRSYFKVPPAAPERQQEWLSSAESALAGRPGAVASALGSPRLGEPLGQQVSEEAAWPSRARAAEPREGQWTAGGPKPVRTQARGTTHVTLLSRQSIVQSL